LINKLRTKVDLRRLGSASEVFADLKTVQVEQIEDFEYLQNLTICPPDRKLAQPDNCTIDNAFLTAINNKETVAQAIAQGHLRGDWPLISYLNASQNGNKSCFQNGYCYGNIARLRSYRILPLGWEIAAALSPVARPVTLGEAVDCFDNGPKCIMDPASNIFYHLLDPNWVLTAPTTQCKALVYGPTLEDVISNQRQQVCVDRPSCLAEDSKGNCTGGYGYCTQERNIWRFTGEQCQEQYSSCQVFVRRDNGAKYTYLQNTLEPCESDQAGCTWYSLSQENIGTPADPNYQWNPQDRIYFNNKVASCGQQDAGCQEFINPGLNGVNLLANGNFDSYALNIATDYADVDYLDDDKVDSFDSWLANGASFKVFTSSSDGAYLGATGLKAVGDGQLSTTAQVGNLIGNTFTLSWYGKANGNCTVNAALGSLSTSAVSADVNYTTEWQRFQLTHTFALDNYDQQLTVFLGSLASCGLDPAVFIDGVKVERGSSPTTYTDYGSSGRVYLNGTRVSCQVQEVGCNLYTPLAGGVAVPGVVTNADRCPNECIGYQTYLQLPTTFEIIETSAGTISVNFIGKTAKQCSATEVGCSEFTNLDEVAAGGEGKHYYSFLRQCVAANLGLTYYTLEGSDTSGFQVRTWQVLKTNIVTDTGPCTNVVPGGLVCADTLATQATCLASEVTTDPNCREFFDTDGISTFRLQDQVIFATSDCHPLRRSSGIVYSGVDQDSRTCSSAVVGCTEYRGNQGNNLRQVSSDTFESGSYAPWQAGTATPVYSSESTNSGGHSLSWTSGVVSRSEGQSIVAGREYYLSFWLKAEAAVTEFRAFLGKFDGTQTKCNGAVCEFTAPSVSPIQPTTSWQLYQLGPLRVDEILVTEDILLQLLANPKVFVDNIVLRESISNLTVVANSWNTPASCDQPFVGANLGCQAYKGPNNTTVALRSFTQICRQEAIGCQAVVNTQNSNSPYQQVFHAGDRSEITVPADVLEYVVIDNKKTCSASFQGCSLLGKPTFNRDLPEVDPDYVKTYTPVFQINDPDRYDQQLCLNSGLFCQEYSDTNGQSVYYRDPYNRTCTYKESVSIQGVSFSGWFQTDSLQVGRTPLGCYSQGIPPLLPDQFEIHSFIDPLYAGWVGTCPANQNQCSEFVDTQATDGENLFTKATFPDGTTGWDSWRAYGNTLTNLTVPVLFSAANGTATIQTNPTGVGLFFQRLFAQDTDPNVTLKIKNTETYNLSADVKIDSFFADDRSKGSVQVLMRCVWDSPYDKDYCATKNGFDMTVNYAAPCVTNADCSGTSFCYKASQGYCESPTNKTNTACGIGAPCDAGYSCTINYGYESTDSQNNRRDHLAEYYVSADIAEHTKTQSLSIVANIGSQSQGDELVYCESTFRVISGYYKDNPGCTGGENDLDCYNTACSNTGLSCNPPTASCGGGGTCGGNSKVQFSNVSLRQVKSYFYLDNNSLDDSSCNGQVSKNTGCILFDDVNNPEKIYNSYLTYLASDQVDGKPVSPVVCDPNSINPQLRSCTNDANRVIKVNRDRECSQWLACRSSSQIFDPQTKGYRQICSEVGLCNKFSNSGDLLNCANWLPEGKTKLDYSTYVSRDIRYEAIDYSGLSLYNRYPVDNLHLLDISINAAKSGPDSLKTDFRLVKFVDCLDSIPACVDANGVGDDQYGQLPFASCGVGKIGKVFLNQNGRSICAVGIDGSRFDPISPYVVPVTTRGYAEQDGPFPQSLASGPQNSNRKVAFGFQQANICDSTIASCETGYYKMQYSSSGLIRYYSINGPLGGTEVPTCICSGGGNDGSACNTLGTSSQCPGGSPVQLRRSDAFLNWPGYCLEPDTSTHINASPSQFACLSWLPVDIAPGGIDYFNQNREAGYSQKAPAYYCLEMGVKEVRTRTQTGCIDSVEDVVKEYRYVDIDGQVKDDIAPSTSGPGDHPQQIIGGKYFAYEFGKSCGGRDNPVALIPISQIYAEGEWTTVDNCVGPIIDEREYEGKTYRLVHTCEADYDQETFKLTNTHKNRTQLHGQIIAGDSEPYTACKYLAEAVSPQGQNAALTNYFWSEYRLGAGTEFDLSVEVAGAPKYKLRQDNQPFGSAVPSSGLVPSDFPRLDVRSVGKIPRAGSPYACSNTALICGLLSKVGERAYVEGWVNPNLGNNLGTETYADGMQRLRAIFQGVFGIYRYTLGNSCATKVCDSGLYGGQACVTDASCDLNTQNTCQSVSNCIDSAWGNKACDITAACAPGFVPNSVGQCVYVTDGQLGCLTSCTSYITSSPPRAVAGTGDCSQTTAPYTCIYTLSLCLADTNNMVCRSNRCYDEELNASTVVKCNQDWDCWFTISELNKTASCAPSDGRLCVGPDFSESQPNSWFKKVQDCKVDVVTDLGINLQGYEFDSGTGTVIHSGNDICQAPNAQCKQSDLVTTYVSKYCSVTTTKACLSDSECLPDGGDCVSTPKPYCSVGVDTYQPLCNPDDNSTTCPYGSSNAVRDDALPLDGTMSHDIAKSSTIFGNTTKVDARPAKYYAEANFGPIIAEANCTDTTGLCTVGKIGNFTVNGRTNGSIVASTTSNLLANISFYALAYKQHMPIRSIRIDWGDGSVQSNIGYYKNNWSRCDATSQLSSVTTPNFRAGVFNYTWGEGSTLDFAGTSQACEEGIRNYFHLYRYDPKYTIGCTTGFACFRPSITIQDNWGWCTGNNWGVVGNGCPASLNDGKPSNVEYGGGDSNDVIKIKAPS